MKTLAELEKHFAPEVVPMLRWLVADRRLSLIGVEELVEAGPEGLDRHIVLLCWDHMKYAERAHAIDFLQGRTTDPKHLRKMGFVDASATMCSIAQEVLGLRAPYMD